MIIDAAGVRFVTRPSAGWGRGSLIRVSKIAKLFLLEGRLLQFMEKLNNVDKEVELSGPLNLEAAGYKASGTSR